MATEKEWTQTDRGKPNIKIAASISLFVLLFSVMEQLIAIFQTWYHLVRPLIPERVIWQIAKQFVFIGLVSAITVIVGLILYFYERYIWVVILAAVVLVAERFIYI